MSTRRDAENVIRKIRKSRHANDKGGAGADANARSLTRALDMLSTQLYTESSHFILELIQNADDNTYAPGVDPLLTLVYREDGYLWVGCNEVGFSRANIEAICDINDSTKKVKDAAKGYIGEKGIGFKSVFKVVWVSSGHYTFRFDRDKTLGMIVPVWCDFNGTSLMSQRTMFCLQIPDIQDRQTVKADLLSLQTELVLFLRKLRRIDIRVYDAGMKKPSLGFALTQHQNPGPQALPIITLARKDLARATKDQSEELAVCTMIREGMPLEPKREGIHASKIVMAFPISSTTQARSPRLVYNFLPIRSYGLPFLLQADFILTANRESISHDNAWNRSLVDGALDLFVSAVHQFNRTGTCKYEWPSFVAGTDAVNGSVFAGFTSRLQNLLQHENVLESQAGYFSRPSELMLVPEHFTDGLDPPKPLFDDVLNTFKYASFRYSPRDLESLGIRYQTPQQVCALLKWMTPAQLEQKSSAWHARLAAGIAKSDPTVFSTAKIIPLRTGEWISSLDEPFYLPSLGSDVDAPTGIEVRVISRTACADPARIELFRLLGAKPISESHICSLILDRHRFLSLSNNNLSTRCLVSHAWYLFSHGGIGMSYGALKIANELGQAVPGDELYMQIPDSLFQMKDYLPSDLFSADFVHPEYLNQGPESDRPRWYKWLTDTLHISFLPNLASNRTRTISREFQYLVDNHPSQVWLTLVRDNWRHYAVDVASVTNQVRSFAVQCTNQRSCQLQDAYLATSAITQEPLAERHTNLVNVPDPRNRDWLNLATLGLRTQPDLTFYLTILRGVAEMHPSDVDKYSLLRLYEAIGARSGEDVHQVRTAFAAQHLILPRPASSSSSWTMLSGCRWNNPSALACVETLSTEYSSCKELFVDILEIPDTGTADVLDEILSRHSDRPAHNGIPPPELKNLLLTLSTGALDDPGLDDRFQRLAITELIPVRTSRDEARLSRVVDKDWFIPDRSRYAKCFEGRIWTLDFPRDQIESLGRLFKRLKVPDRRLSRHVTEATIAEGEALIQPHITEQVQSKARYISLLASEPLHRKDVFARMASIQIVSCTKLLVRRYVTVHDQKIYGKDEKGWTALDCSTTPARLYFSTETVAGAVLPWYSACDGLLSFLGLAIEKHSLLNGVLYTQGHASIEDILERAGLLEIEDCVYTDHKESFVNGVQNSVHEASVAG